MVAIAMAAIWAVTFTWLSVVRHLAGGSHAEDLGFTDQVLANFLRGQWFRMSIYEGATWNTELDVSRLARPDSLFAFHVEPMLLLLVPLYALGAGALALLVIQSVAVAAGAIPIYRLGRYASGTPVGGLAVAGAYLLSPLGQWAVLDDFHTSILAAPLLVLSVERLVVGRAPVQALLAAGLAVTAREDVGPVLAGVGLALLLTRRWPRTSAAFLALGLASSIVSELVFRAFSGGIAPFEVRYGGTLGAGLGPSLSALTRPTVLDYVGTLLLSGGWLGILAPLALLPALPGLALNVLSTSPWMAAGKAHYSGLVLPFIALAAAAGLWRLRHVPRLRDAASLALVATSLIGYVLEGAGPFGGNYAPGLLTDHSARAATMAANLPLDAAVSASSSLVPRLSRRAHVYVFPTLLDAEYVFLDVRASPAPTSAGDVFLRVRDMLATDDWHMDLNQDGLLLLRRSPVRPTAAAISSLEQRDVGGDVADVRLRSASLVPSPDGAVDVDGPRWILRTTWQTPRPLPPATRLHFYIDLQDGAQLHVWDVADLWWNPPERWTPGQDVTVDVPDVPIRRFKAWSAAWSTS